MGKKGNIEEQFIPGIKIISLVFYAGSISLLLLSIFFLTSATLSKEIIIYFPELTSTEPKVFIFFSLIFLPFSILYYFIGHGISIGKNSARINAIILGSLSLIAILYSMIKGYFFQNLPGFILVLMINLYLLFSKESKKHFRC